MAFYRVWQLLLFAFVLTLISCDGARTTNDLFDDYIGRLERVLELDIVKVDPVTTAYPSRRQLQVATQEVKIDFLDFLGILDCDLNRVIAGRNSVLGKVMQPSQRWLYEVSLLSALEDCIRHLQTQEEPPEVLTELFKIKGLKERELPAVVWNATWAGPEFQQLFSSRYGPLTAAFRFSDHAELSAALSSLAKWSRQPGLLTDASAYEASNQTLAITPIIGRLLVSYQESIHYLNAINQAVEVRLAARPVCFQGRPNRDAKILSNVLQKVFIGGIQPHLSELDKAFRTWMYTLQSTHEKLPGEIQEKADLIEAVGLESDLRQAFLMATRAHTRVWNDILQQCGLRVGTANV